MARRTSGNGVNRKRGGTRSPHTNDYAQLEYFQRRKNQRRAKALSVSRRDVRPKAEAIRRQDTALKRVIKLRRAMQQSPLPLVKRLLCLDKKREARRAYHAFKASGAGSRKTLKRKQQPKRNKNRFTVRC